MNSSHQRSPAVSMPIKALVTALHYDPTYFLKGISNKHLVPIANKPMIVYAIENLASWGVSDIGILSHIEDKSIQGVLGDGSQWGVQLTYLPQHETSKSTALAVYEARNFIQDSPFILYVGDNFIADNFQSHIRRFLDGDLNCLLAFTQTAHPERFSVPIFEQNKLRAIEERPVGHTGMYAVAGLYLYDQNFFKIFQLLHESSGAMSEISDISSYLIQNKYRVEYVHLRDWWKDRGETQDLLIGNQFALTHFFQPSFFSQPNVVVERNVMIGKNVKFEGNVVLRGPLSIGSQCVVQDAYIGPYTSIGSGVEIYGGYIENSLVYANSVISTQRNIQGSIIGEDSSVLDAQTKVPRSISLIAGHPSKISI